MLETDIPALRAAFDDHNIEVPQSILDAEALELAAAKLLDDIKAQPAPDVTTVTAANVAKVHKVMVGWKDRAPEFEAAQQIIEYAHANWVERWHAHYMLLMTALEEPFNALAARYVESGSEDDLSEIVALSRVRNILATNPGGKANCGGNSKAEQMTRLITPPSREAALRNIPIANSSPGSREFWRAMRTMPYIKITWNTPVRQDEIWNSIPHHNLPEHSAAFVKRTRAEAEKNNWVKQYG